MSSICIIIFQILEYAFQMLMNIMHDNKLNLELLLLAYVMPPFII